MQALIEPGMSGLLCYFLDQTYIYLYCSFPQSTTSSPKGCHFTSFSLAAGIGVPLADHLRGGETTTPSCPSQVGAIVTITEPISAA